MRKNMELVKEVSIPAGTLKIKTSKVRLSKEIKKQIEKEVINEIIDYYIKEAPTHQPTLLLYLVPVPYHVRQHINIFKHKN